MDAGADRHANVERRRSNTRRPRTVFLAAGGQPTPTPARALDPGIVGNLEPGATMTLVSPGPGVNGEATVIQMDFGVDDETTDELRERVLLRIREPPQGGANIDYVQWALGVPGVTRAWCYALEMGMGTVTVRFMMDNLSARPRAAFRARATSTTSMPRSTRCGRWRSRICSSSRRSGSGSTSRSTASYPDTPTVRAAIGLSLQVMLRERAVPGQTIYAAWKNFAIMSAPGVVSYTLSNAQDDYMASPGHMPVLGNIVYGGGL